MNYELGLQHYLNGNLAVASEIFKQELITNPGNYLAKNLLGLCYMKTNETEAAIRCFQEVCGQEQDIKSAYEAAFNIGLIHYNLNSGPGDFAEAFKWFQAALYLALRSGRTNNHNLLFLKAASFWNIFKNEDYYDNWSNGLFSGERTIEVAYKDIQKAIEQNDKEDVTYYYVAYQMAEQLSDTNQYNIYYEKVMALLHPESK